MQQGTDEWLQARAGHITASCMSVLLVKGKGPNGLGAGALTYATELAVERLMGHAIVQDDFKNAEWGHEVEPHAREAYEVRTGSLVSEAGFITHPSIPYVGASPDGLIGSDGGLELKCPINPRRHMETLLGGMPKEHEAQVQGCLLVTGRKWWDFGSYHPELPEAHRLYVQRVMPDPAVQAKLHSGIEALLAHVESLLMKVAA